jgi:AcrR family transcriptional regulator
MDTSQKIIEASIKVFTENGYLGSSTKEIAKTADVAEMTLFRKFQSKQNLFETMIKSTLGHQLSDVLDVNFNLSLEEFVSRLLHNRLTSISKNIHIVRMVIQESIQGRIPEDLNYISQISNKIKEAFEQYQKVHNEYTELSLNAVISGILLQYAVLTPRLNYHILSERKQKEYLSDLMSQIRI